MDPLDDILNRRLADLERDDLLRRPKRPAAARGLVPLCSNDYLGLRADPALLDGAVAAARVDGIGAGASRLIDGTHPAHTALEAALAAWWGTPGALVFSSGYAANVGTLAALLQPGDAVFSDALNHASLIDGIRLSRAERHVFAHADVADLDARLAACTASGLRLVVVESIYSMDGDRAPLPALVEVCRRRGATLVVDEAHALGVCGPAGRGLVAELGLEADVGVRIGTFGKSFGTAGAFVAGSEALMAWLYNRARSFVFSTAVSPLVAGAAHAALERVARGDRTRELVARIDHVSRALVDAGWLDAPLQSAIAPLVVGTPAAALAAEARLAEAGYAVPAIRPPTVPVGTSRLRMTVTLGPSLDDYLRAIDALGPPPR